MKERYNVKSCSLGGASSYSITDKLDRLNPSCLSGVISWLS